MTLDGTNTYVVLDAGRSKAIVVDPGPVIEDHLQSIVSAVRLCEVEVLAVVTTHAHPDHAALGNGAADEFEVPFLSAQEISESASAHRLLSRCDISALATPGHSADSLSYVSADAVLLSGDHLLGRGTTAILHPDGSLGQYLRSLTAVEATDFSMIAPGHGPEMDAELGRRVIAYYRAHRLERIEQIQSLLAEGYTSVSALVSHVYGQIENPIVAWSARASTLATVAYIGEEGEWVLDGDEIYRRSPQS
jgi:glyoxylase-like metal-dependent hydrolase (beta-lactamase superfamily II)